MASAALLVFVVFLVGIAISTPIGTSMVLGSLAPILLMGKGGQISQVLNNTFGGANSTPILAVPLFILGGVIMAEGGISKKLFPPAENYKISSAFSYNFKSALTVLSKGAASADAKVYSPTK